MLDHRRAHEDAERGERRVQDEHRVRAARVAVQDAARRRGGDVDRVGVGVRGRRAGTVGLIAIGEGGEHGRVVDDLVDRGGRKPEEGHTCPERVVAGYNIEISYLRAKSDERLAPPGTRFLILSLTHMIVLPMARDSVPPSSRTNCTKHKVWQSVSVLAYVSKAK